MTPNLSVDHYPTPGIAGQSKYRLAGLPTNFLR